MKIHPLSFGLGIASAALLLIVALMVMRIGSSSTVDTTVSVGSTFTGSQSSQRGFSTSRMAERLGMTQQELQKELDSGKTMQQIAQEHGVSLAFGRRSGSGADTQASGSGALRMRRSSSSASSQ